MTRYLWQSERGGILSWPLTDQADRSLLERKRDLSAQFWFVCTPSIETQDAETAAIHQAECLLRDGWARGSTLAEFSGVRKRELTLLFRVCSTGRDLHWILGSMPSMQNNNLAQLEQQPVMNVVGLDKCFAQRWRDPLFFDAKAKAHAFALQKSLQT